MAEIFGEDVVMGSTVSSSTSTALEAAAARVGDRWALLIVDALLQRPQRFTDLESALPGLAPNVLTARLRRLAEDGLIVAEPYSERPLRYEYRASAAGRELAGALRLLASWGARADETGESTPSGSDTPVTPRHLNCGTPLEARWYCPTCERLADLADPGEEALAWL